MLCGVAVTCAREVFFMKMRWILVLAAAIVATSSIGHAQTFKVEKFV